MQASLTGHLVLATLHTNDTTSAVTRLVDMGIEPFLLASSLIGVLAQRLVRRLCPACKRADQLDSTQLTQFGAHPAPAQLYRAVGCPACNLSGYQGRMGIYELLEVDDGLRRMVHERAADHALRDYAMTTGTLRPLREDGLRWVAGGDTTLEELLRVTRN